MTRIFTIGHSNHTLEKLARLLKDNGVQTLVDVRTAPYSRFSPQFNSDNLKIVLPELGIQYVFLGQLLGGRPADPACYKNRELPQEGTDYLHEVDYPEVMKRPWFQEGIRQLLATAEASTTAILCSEEDPSHCHRHHLISRYLLAENPEIDVQHIRGDGVVFNARTILTSVNKPKATQGTLF